MARLLQTERQVLTENCLLADRLLPMDQDKELLPAILAVERHHLLMENFNLAIKAKEEAQRKATELNLMPLLVIFRQMEMLIFQAEPETELCLLLKMETELLPQTAIGMAQQLIAMTQTN